MSGGRTGCFRPGHDRSEVRRCRGEDAQNSFDILKIIEVFREFQFFGKIPDLSFLPSNSRNVESPW